MIAFKQLGQQIMSASGGNMKALTNQCHAPASDLVRHGIGTADFWPILRAISAQGTDQRPNPMPRPAIGPPVPPHSSGRAMQSELDLAERYRKEADKLADLARTALPGVFRTTFKKTAVRYLRMWPGNWSANEASRTCKAPCSEPCRGPSASPNSRTSRQETTRGLQEPRRPQ
jgi:hypothetical protein